MVDHAKHAVSAIPAHAQHVLLILVNVLIFKKTIEHSQNSAQWYLEVMASDPLDILLQQFQFFVLCYIVKKNDSAPAEQRPRRILNIPSFAWERL